MVYLHNKLIHTMFDRTVMRFDDYSFVIKKDAHAGSDRIEIKY